MAKRKVSKKDVGFGVAGSLMSIIIGSAVTSSKGDYALKQSKKLDELYIGNKKELLESYEKNWYNNNFRFIDQRDRIINEAIKVENDFIGKMGMIDNANNITGGSYMNDVKNNIEEEKKKDVSNLEFNKAQQDEADLSNYNKSTLKLAEQLVEQNEGLSDNFKQIREQDKANTISQLANAGSLMGEYYVDNYYTKKAPKQTEIEKFKIK